jgi:mannose/fructose/N-acetylgalactosamine-specific phosphotransferase system component IIB
MALLLLRVDQRLLHGQVVEGWVPFLKADAVVVADDGVAADPISKIAMTAACPAKVKLEVMGIGDAASAAAKGALPGARTLMLVRSIEGLSKLWDGGARAAAINLGNVPIGPGRTRVTPSVALSADELKALDAIAAGGVLIEVQAVPREKAANLQAVHKVLGA